MQCAPASAVLATKLSKASRAQRWEVDEELDWPASIDDDAWCTSPELVSIAGTDLWASLDEPTRVRVARFEAGNFFSLTLQGERPLVAGMSDLLYSTRISPEATEYIHHFIDEENKHMAMFGRFCRTYIGKVYPEKKVNLPRRYASGERIVAMFCKIMVVEEVGDYYNVLMQADTRLPRIVREIHRVHHRDESRHIGFGRSLMRELWATYASGWSVAERAGFQAWLANYMKSSWGDFYNPSVYRDAGLDRGPDGVDPYALRREAIESPQAVELRARASRRLIGFFLREGLLEEAPSM